MALSLILAIGHHKKLPKHVDIHKPRRLRRQQIEIYEMNLTLTTDKDMKVNMILAFEWKT